MLTNSCDHVKHWLNYVIVAFLDLCFHSEVSPNGFTLICSSVCQCSFPRKLLGLNNPSKLMELYLSGKFLSNHIYLEKGTKIAQKEGLTYFSAKQKKF